MSFKLKFFEITKIQYNTQKYNTQKYNTQEYNTQEYNTKNTIQYTEIQYIKIKEYKEIKICDFLSKKSSREILRLVPVVKFLSIR